jgi:hypothetical protein
LGIKLGTEGGFCTHLAAVQIVRTEKFLCAIAYGPVVVSLDWVEDCLAQETLLGKSLLFDLTLAPEDYLLQDRSNEEKYGMRLEQSIIKARKNNRKLFKDYQIYISTAAKGHVAIQHIVEVNGGEARIVSHNLKQRGKILRSDHLKPAENKVLICTREKDDKDLRAKFKEETMAEGYSCLIFSSEWIMRCVLRQEIREDNEFALSA